MTVEMFSVIALSVAVVILVWLIHKLGRLADAHHVALEQQNEMLDLLIKVLKNHEARLGCLDGEEPMMVEDRYGSWKFGQDEEVAGD